MEYKLIDTQEDLEFYLPQIEIAKFMAIDTEFNRDNKYYPNLSLLQICYTIRVFKFYVVEPTYYSFVILHFI
jgi:ribonuclease D